LIFEFNSAAAGVIVESEDIHRMAYNATFAHFDVRCPNAPGTPVVWTEEYYDDLQNRVGCRWLIGHVFRVCGDRWCGSKSIMMTCRTG